MSGRFGRGLLGVVGLVAVVLATQAPAALAAPVLSRREAGYYLRVALGREFGGQFKSHASYSPGCRRRSASRFRCAVRWATGDFDFAGTAQIWTSVNSGQAIWNYSWHITRTDDYCAQVEHETHCTRTYVVR